MDNSKRKNIYIIVFVVTTIIAASVAIYFGVKASDKSADLQIANKDMEDYKSQLEQAKSSINKGEVTVPKTEEKVVEKIVEKSKFVPFDPTKCITPNNNVNYGAGAFHSDLVDVFLENGKIRLTFTEEMKKYTSNSKIVNASEIFGFSGKVVDVLIGVIGLDLKNTTILFLMEDGTVEYMPIIKAAQSGTFKSYGKLKEVTSVVRMVQGGMAQKDGIGGGQTPFLIRDNSQFYVVSDILADMKMLLD